MAEIGRIGQKRWNGVFYEEFLRDLQGIRGVEVYREMANNDDTIGAILFAIKMLIRHTVWNIEPGGDSAKDREAAEFVESCMDDMQSTWTDTISEILSFLVYGWSLHEIVYKRRMGKTRSPRTKSKYSDGLIGWQKLPIRSQDTLYKWEYDRHDNLIGMTQMPPPDYGFITIPMKKAMLFRTESAKDNPEGRSILRNAYRPWYFKRRIQEIEAIGIERDLAGLPVFHTPEGTDIWDDTDPEMIKINAALTRMVKSVRRDEYEGLVLPHGFEFELVSTGGARQFDTNAIINRYDTKIAMTVLADFLMLGHNKVGSFALSSDPPDYGFITIPMKKAMLFRTESAKDNPEGRSILRNAYRPWYFKRRIQEIEAIGIERDLAGLPVFHTPEGTDIWDDTDPEMIKINAALTRMVKSVRRDEYEGLVLPHGFEFELVSTGGARQFDTNAIINRYDTKIAMTVLADFLMLGHNKVGSFALSSDKTELFSVAISSFLDVICETFNNQSIPALIDINGDHFNGITDYPKMTHGEIEDVDIKSAGQFIKDMTGIGIIVPDDGLEDYVREIGHLPERATDNRREDPARTAQQNQNQPPEDDLEDPEEIDDDQDEKNAKAAKRRLGRER